MKLNRDMFAKKPFFLYIIQFIFGIFIFHRLILILFFAGIFFQDDALN